jgi:hypothetical protein
MKTTIELQQNLIFPMEKPFPNEAKFTAWFGKKIHDA